MKLAILLFVPALAAALPFNTTRLEHAGGVVPFTEVEYAIRLSRWTDAVNSLNTSTPATCSKDMRSKMPACHQFGSMWCWATGVAALTEYYKSSGPAQCNGLECQIVSWCPKPPSCSSSTAQCCPFKAHLKECGGDGATTSMIIDAAKHFTGHPHSYASGPMPQNALDASLQAGKPVLMLVGYGDSKSPSHVVQIRGCGDGKYYFWDPEWQVSTGAYPKGSDKRSYSELVTYKYPSGATQKWLDTVHAS